ncbi:hypothetical protein P5673_013873 [Acropora cervicornis]|uniref:Uncharacterized protein n=1 Tax=Acropora cervicornis TaxID=6130 RepID=A0AAD9QKJ2_ACRCE|nr:hypothetical protein P5673_013873 [Acropora cervicornis]
MPRLQVPAFKWLLILTNWRRMKSFTDLQGNSHVLRIFVIVPHQQLCSRRKVLKCSVINVAIILKSKHVLLAPVSRTANIPHPASIVLIMSIDVEKRFHFMNRKLQNDALIQMQTESNIKPKLTSSASSLDLGIGHIVVISVERNFISSVQALVKIGGRKDDCFCCGQWKLFFLRKFHLRNVRQNDSIARVLTALSALTFLGCRKQNYAAPYPRRELMHVH